MMSTMLYQRVPSDLIAEPSQRGRMLSILAAVSMGTLFLLETHAYFFSTTLKTDLSLNTYNKNNNKYSTTTTEDPYIRLNLDITMMDLPCEQATIDIYSAIGYQKNITRHIRKYPIDAKGVRQRYEARNWHQNDIQLWDPAIVETIDDLHHDGEDAISLDAHSFPYAVENFSFLFVSFYSNDCESCNDLAPTWEALGEVVTDTSMQLVDDHMKENDIDPNHYSDDEYEASVNQMAPVLVTKLNCSLHPSVCNEQDIRVYPTMRVFVNGEAKGDYNGHRTLMELVHWLGHIEADNTKSPGEHKMKRVADLASKRSVRNDEEKEWNDALSKYRSPLGSWHSNTRYPGCQLTGHIMVDKAPGELLVHSQSYGHAVAAHMTNLSHIVHHFSFGEVDAIQYADEQQHLPGVLSSGLHKSLHPMDGNVYVTEQLHQAYHHHLRVIAMEFSVGNVVFKSLHEKARRVYRILQNSQLSTYRHNIVPEVKFSYDLSPITVSYHQVSRNWYDYFTSLMAIIGGVFTVVGMMDTGLSSFSKKKSSHYY